MQDLDVDFDPFQHLETAVFKPLVAPKTQNDAISLRYFARRDKNGDALAPMLQVIVPKKAVAKWLDAAAYVTVSVEFSETHRLLKLRVLAGDGTYKLFSGCTQKDRLILRMPVPLGRGLVPNTTAYLPRYKVEGLSLYIDIPYPLMVTQIPDAVRKEAAVRLTAKYGGQEYSLMKEIEAAGKRQALRVERLAEEARAAKVAAPVKIQNPIALHAAPPPAPEMETRRAPLKPPSAAVTAIEEIMREDAQKHKAAIEAARKAYPSTRTLAELELNDVAKRPRSRPAGGA